MTEQLVSHSDSAGLETILVVDMANVVDSVPDGWWRDRVAAAQRLITALESLAEQSLPGPDGAQIAILGVVAILEGKANRASSADPDTPGGPVEVVRAGGSGDDEIVARVGQLGRAGQHVMVVTADRGLRARLPEGVALAGPGWLNGLLGRGTTARRPSE